jgi:NAD(P)-dependent dehydrogenase (short-subunit alcohol dehydrogenase family)
VCRRLASSGGTVALAGRPSDRLERLTRELDAAKWELDASDPARIEVVVAEVVERFGRIDGVANCIGSLLLKPAHLTSFDDWNGVIGANLTSAFAVVRSALPNVMERFVLAGANSTFSAGRRWMEPGDAVWREEVLRHPGGGTELAASCGFL